MIQCIDRLLPLALVVEHRPDAVTRLVVGGIDAKTLLNLAPSLLDVTDVKQDNRMVMPCLVETGLYGKGFPRLRQCFSMRKTVRMTPQQFASNIVDFRQLDIQ